MKRKSIEKFKILGYERLWEADAADIVAARERSQIIHGTGNIRAAGDEVERPVRALLARRLPDRYLVTHGHIVDAKLQVSPQLDVVVVNKAEYSPLMRGDAGDEYVPYELVHAVGEIKSSYRIIDVITFINTIRGLKDVLKREETPTVQPGLMPIGNPLFTFMVFVDSSKFRKNSITRLLQIYGLYNYRHLPNVICFLDRGLFVHITTFTDIEYENLGRIKSSTSSLHIDYWPEYIRGPYQDGFQTFQLRSFGEAKYYRGANLANLHFCLMWHLSHTQLGTPDLIPYLERLLKINPLTVQT